MCGFLRVKTPFSFVICLIGLPQTLWKRRDTVSVQVLRLVAEEVDEIHLEIFPVIELLLAQIVGKRTEQMVELGS